MLRLMLNRHSRLAIPFESHFLVKVFAKLPSDRPLVSNEADRMADLVVGEKNFQTWHLDPNSVRKKMRQLAHCSPRGVDRRTLSDGGRGCRKASMG